MLSLTEINQSWGRLIFKAEISKITKVKRSTLDSYLNLEKFKGIIEYPPHRGKSKFDGGVFRLTRNGRERLKEELKNKSLDFLNVINLSNQSLEKANPITNLDELIRKFVKLL